jgi:glutamate-ammonia-ligase adenylyltransferase
MPDERLASTLAGTPLAASLATAAAPLVERRGGDAAWARLAGRPAAGLARAVASRPEVGGFLSHRPRLLERIAALDAGSAAARSAELETWHDLPEGDLEADLDALRILRREETVFAACLDLGGLATFAEVSQLLSILAEVIARRALELAERSISTPGLSVIGLGKIAGREFTYHSDLDLVFLHAGGADALADASRIGQRLISYLTTMTGAGIAYAVDTRLRPSGRQGTLVTSLPAFARYQTEQAETWEHMAMLRARAIAGRTQPAEEVLARVRKHAQGRGAAVWDYVADLRRRVESERAGLPGDAIPFKTGAGGLMDVDFLAAGGVLELGVGVFPALPGVPELLRAVLPSDRSEALLADYAFLRVVEARARWVAGRGVERLEPAAPGSAAIAELVESGLSPHALVERIAAARRRVRAAWHAVVAARTIRALAD